VRLYVNFYLTGLICVSQSNEAKWLLIDNPVRRKVIQGKRRIRIVLRGFTPSLDLFLSDFSSGGVFGSESVASDE
jgi:hypothetical protein